MIIIGYLWSNLQRLDQQIQLADWRCEPTWIFSVEQVADRGVISLVIGIGIADIGKNNSISRQRGSWIAGFCQFWGRDGKNGDDIVIAITGYSLEKIKLSWLTKTTKLSRESGRYRRPVIRLVK